MTSAPLLRIGELSKRTGVRAERLRAWHRRVTSECVEPTVDQLRGLAAVMP